MSRGSADFFAINDGKLGRIRGRDLGVRKSEIVVGDGKEREIGFFSSGNHLRKSAAPTRCIGVHVNDANTLASRRCAREAGKTCEEPIQPDGENEADQQKSKRI